jgi:FtsZ-binding cell division protein ZapB
MIDWNVRVGDLLVLAGLGGTMMIYAFKSGRFAETIDMMQEEIEELKDTAKTIAGALTTMAVQKVQIERVEQDIADMKRGIGYKQDHGARTIDREYP